LAIIFNEIKCRDNTSLGLVGGCIPCIPPVSALVQHYNTSMPVPSVSHSDVTCDSHAVPVNRQSRSVSSNPGDSSRSNNSRPQRDRRPPVWMRDYTA